MSGKILFFFYLMVENRLILHKISNALFSSENPLPQTCPPHKALAGGDTENTEIIFISFLTSHSHPSWLGQAETGALPPDYIGGDWECLQQDCIRQTRYIGMYVSSKNPITKFCLINFLNDFFCQFKT